MRESSFAACVVIGRDVWKSRVIRLCRHDDVMARPFSHLFQFVGAFAGSNACHWPKAELPVEL
jgi:hypothetical protein